VDASDVALAQLHDVDVSGLANGDLLIYSSTSNTWVVIPSSSIQGQNTNPGGSNTYIQFDDSGAFGGVSGLTFNKATNTAFVGNTVNVGANVSANTTMLKVGNSSINAFMNSSTISTTGNIIGVIDCGTF